jgi:hypothetical protein
MKSKALKTLQTLIPDLFFHTLNYRDLGLEIGVSAASNLYEKAGVEAWRDVISSTFSGCAYYALEVSRGDYKAPKRGNIHAHIIAGSQDGVGLHFLNTEKCKPINNLEGLLTYLCKPPEPYSLDAVLDFKVSKLLNSDGKAPRTRGWLLSAERQSWNRQNTLPMP